MSTDLEQLLRSGGPRPSPDPARRAAARAAVHAAWRDGVRERTQRKRFAVATTALAVAATVALAVWLRPAPSDVPEIVGRITVSTAAASVNRDGSRRVVAMGDELRAGDVLETPAGVVLTITMAAGEQLRQNGATSVRWISPARVSLQTGQIYVNTDGAGSGVVIETPAGAVRDIGTQFDVDVRGARVRVRVRDGVVRLESPSGYRQANAGHELEAHAGSTPVTRPIPTFGAEWDWILRSTAFRLEGATLDQFVGWIESEGGRRVEFRPQALRAETSTTVLHGSVRGLTMSEAMAVVLPAAGLTFREEDRSVVIERPRGRAR